MSTDEKEDSKKVEEEESERRESDGNDKIISEEKISEVCGKLEIEIDIKASAEQFHHMFRHKPHHVHNTTSKIQGCQLEEGEYGTIGSVITWNYFHEGSHKVAKHVVEEIDDEKNSITFKQIGGDLMEHHKSLSVTIRATPKSDGQGCVIHWTIVYEKHHGDIIDPHTMLDFAHQVSKDLELHLLQEQQDS